MPRIANLAIGLKLVADGHHRSLILVIITDCPHLKRFVAQETVQRIRPVIVNLVQRQRVRRGVRTSQWPRILAVADAVGEWDEGT